MVMPFIWQTSTLTVLDWSCLTYMKKRAHTPGICMMPLQAKLSGKVAHQEQTTVVEWLVILWLAIAAKSFGRPMVVLRIPPTGTRILSVHRQANK